MNTEIELAANKQMAVAAWNNDEMGYENLLSQDVTPPRIYLMQPMTPMVVDGNAKGGEIRESVDGTLLGGLGKPTKIVPFFITNTWVIRQNPNGASEWEYVRAEDRTAQNANLEWEFVENGINMKREKTMNVFCLKYDDVLAGRYVPYLVSFQRTSFTSAAKKLSQLMTLLKGAKRPLFSVVLELDSMKRQNESNKTYYTFEVQLAKENGKEVSLSVEQQNEAYSNYLAVREAYNQGKIQKHVEEDTSTEDAPF